MPQSMAAKVTVRPKSRIPGPEMSCSRRRMRGSAVLSCCADQRLRMSAMPNQIAK
jgi:hypothetical protein